jgi:hypothetical protein
MRTPRHTVIHEANDRARIASRVTSSPPPAATSSGLAVAAAWMALLVGALYAAMSAYWALGGTGLLYTVGGTLEREGLAGDPSLIAVLWVTVALKLIASLLGPIAVVVRLPVRPRHRRLARRAAWATAVICVAYGGVLTLDGLLVQLNVVHRWANSDDVALRWHAYLWDPWFLFWGLLLAFALVRSRAE